MSANDELTQAKADAGLLSVAAASLKVKRSVVEMQNQELMDSFYS